MSIWRFPRVACSLFVLVCVYAPGLGADPLPPPQTDLHINAALMLNQLVAQTVARHPEQAMLTGIAAADRAVQAESGRWLAEPATLSLTLFDDTLASDVGLRELEAGISLPLYWRGQQRQRRRLAEHSGQVSQAADAAVRLQVAGEIRRRLWAVVRTDNEAAQAKQAWQIARALEQDVAKRVAVGDLAKTALLTAQAETLARQSAYLDAEQALQEAWQGYTMLTGRDELPHDFRETQTGREQITPDHPRIAQTRARLQQQQAELAVTRADTHAHPSLTLGGRRERGSDAGPTINSVSIGVSIPLGAKGVQGRELAAAQRELGTLKRNLQALYRELELALHQASRQLATQRQGLVTAERQQQLAMTRLTLARKAFALGETDVAELLDAQNNAFAARRAKRARRIGMQAAIAEYNQAIGVTP